MNITVFEDIRKEFDANPTGITYSSKRGLGRLCGVKHNSWGQHGYVFNKELDAFIIEELELNCSGSQNDENKPFSLLEVLINKGLIVVVKSKMQLQDILCSLVIEFYANKRIPEARLTNRALRAIGLRTVIQKTLGWSQQPKSYEAHILTEPRKWTKVFGDDFYDELARLTGLTWDKKTHRKPHKFAQCTDELIYDHLPDDFKAKLKETSSKHEYNMYKLHQFFDPKSLEFLKNHLQKVIHIMSGETSYETAKLKIAQSITKNYQHNLFG